MLDATSSHRNFIYCSNKYNAASACEHCEGIIRHEHWCITHNSHVIYAYAVVADSQVLNYTDLQFLRGMGIIWQGKICMGKLKREQLTTRPSSEAVDCAQPSEILPQTSEGASA